MTTPEHLTALRIAAGEDVAAWEAAPTNIGRWFHIECPLLQYVRAVLASGGEVEPSFVKRLEACDFDKVGETYFPKGSSKPQDVPLLQARCANTLRGMTATVLAANALARVVREPASYAEFLAGSAPRLRAAVESYAKAWGLISNGVEPRFAERATMESLPWALRALVDAAPVDEGTAPAWLAVLRLLDYLLGAADPPVDERARPGDPANPVRARVLFNAGTFGVVQDIAAASEEHRPAHWYVDPVALGLTVLRANFIESLQLAWRACESASLSLKLQSRAIRLTRLRPKDLPRDAPSPAPQLLDGPSAGALFACAMYAAATGVELNTDASASVALRLRSSRSLTDGQPITLNDIELDQVSGIPNKLAAAIGEELRTVVLTTDQQQEALAKWKTTQDGRSITLKPAKTLDDVFQELTGNARIERVLLDYCQTKTREWEETWTGTNEVGRQFGLVNYVPSRHALLRPEAAGKAGKLLNRTDGPIAADHEYEEIVGDTEEARLQTLLEQSGPRLCISEGPGAGKSVFTRRLLGFVSSDVGRAALFRGKASLAVRWEDDGTYGRSWPADLRKDLLLQLKPYCQKHSCRPAAVLQYAIAHERLVVILDALDQASQLGKRAFLRFLQEVQADANKVRIVLTGRPFAIERIRNPRLPAATWRFGKVLPFNALQQHQFLRGPIGPDANSPEAWRRRPVAADAVMRLFRLRPLPTDATEETAAEELAAKISGYSDVQELLGNPQALYYFRFLAESRGGRIRFHTRSDLYLKVARELLTRGIERVKKRTPEDHEIERAEALLAAAAFQMMARHPEKHLVNGGRAVEQLKHDAGQRVRPIVPPPTFGSKRRDEWKWLEKISVLTNRTLLTAATERTMAWPDRRMMEFYAGLHLARNGEPGWARTTSESPRCGEAIVRRHAADPRWTEAWRFALEMPTEARTKKVLLASLAELFQPVTQRKRAHAGEQWLRPTELMYRAWCLLEDLPPHERAIPRPVLLPGGSQVIAAFRGQFTRLLDVATSTADAACQLVTLDEWKRRGIPIGRLGKKAKPPPPNFVSIRAETHVRLGADDDSAADDERPVHDVALAAFDLQSTTVTREQYALFDSAYLQVNQGKFAYYERKSLRCPASYTSFFDAWCFARWVSARLPTEAEWEYACGAGSTKKYCRDASGAEIDTEADLKKVAQFGQSWDLGPAPVAQLAANYFGLYDMHGNVWEWCNDWYDAAYYQELVGQTATNPVGPVRGSGRVLRGGSWGSVAGGCRAAFRYRLDPSRRIVDLGFRLARVWSAEPVPVGKRG